MIDPTKLRELGRRAKPLINKNWVRFVMYRRIRPKMKPSQNRAATVPNSGNHGLVAARAATTTPSILLARRLVRGAKLARLFANLHHFVLYKQTSELWLPDDTG
jgi:hypothetical protein